MSGDPSIEGKSPVSESQVVTQASDEFLQSRRGSLGKAAIVAGASLLGDHFLHFSNNITTGISEGGIRSLIVAGGLAAGTFLFDEIHLRKAGNK